ncbi:hypothetical protein LGN30_04655 [Burkholderia seminalis]|uniref:hypothetical protein n=1 Tax=Burkholderia seminalis TaxID=488731 RepID=UPI001CF587AC|nr:hypothetical protein [Burkholderia seminalis]MCA8422470.1 hypothetical protein [Burkholderia seminalis]
MKIGVDQAARVRGACVTLMAALAGGCAGTGQQAPQADVGNGSSYTCHPTPVDGQATAGRGVNGCYFVLYDPATKQALPTRAMHSRFIRAPPRTAGNSKSKARPTRRGARSTCVPPRRSMRRA